MKKGKFDLETCDLSGQMKRTFSASDHFPVIIGAAAELSVAIICVAVLFDTGGVVNW